MPTFQTPTDWKSTAWWQNRSVEERLYHARFPKRYADANVPLTGDLRKMVMQYQPGDSLLLYGSSGTGKTASAATVLASLIKNFGLSGRFVSSDTYIEMLKDQFGGSDNLLPEMYSTPYLVKYLQGVFDVVLLDGLGQERETEFSVHEIGSLLRRRHDDMRSTIITTTLTPMTLIRRYGDRVSGVINAMTAVRLA